MKTVFVTVLGFQPAATAVAIRTWCADFGPPDRAVMLATPAIAAESHPARLRAFCAAVGIASVEIVRISDQVHAGGDLPTCVDALLALHGLKAVGAPQDPHVARLASDARRGQFVNPTLRDGFRFENVDAPCFDLAFERAGYLFLMKHISNSGSGSWADVVRPFGRLNNVLNGLQPRIGIHSPVAAVRVHARALHLHDLSTTQRGGQRQLTSWLCGQVAIPGETTFLPADHSADDSRAPVSGTGGRGSPLACWLGPDPSATLIALATHSPRLAWVLFDTGTAECREMVTRLRQNVPRLPVGEVRFVPSDLHGRDAAARLSADPDFAEEIVDVNLTPGRHSQMLSLATVPGTRAWTLASHRGVAMPLGWAGDELRLVSPGIDVQARMCGGRLSSQLRRPEGGRGGAFLVALGRFLRRVRNIDGVRTRVLPLQPRRFSDGDALTLGKQFLVTEGGRSAHHGPFNVSDGFWFESVVAAAFREAGADEVGLNLKWPWPSAPGEGRSADGFRTEVDVVARFGTSFVVVSCKAGVNVSLASTCREWEAVARQTFGRLAVPIVVRPYVDERIVAGLVTARRGVVVLDFLTVGDREALKTTMDLVVTSRHRVVS